MEKRYYCHCGRQFKEKDSCGMYLIHKTTFKCNTCNETLTLIEDYEEDVLKAEQEKFIKEKTKKS